VPSSSAALVSGGPAAQQTTPRSAWAISVRDHTGIIAGEVLFAAEPVGAALTGLPDPNEFMEGQW